MVLALAELTRALRRLCTDVGIDFHWNTGTAALIGCKPLNALVFSCSSGRQGLPIQLEQAVAAGIGAGLRFAKINQKLQRLGHGFPQ